MHDCTLVIGLLIDCTGVCSYKNHNKANYTILQDKAYKGNAYIVLSPFGKILTLVSQWSRKQDRNDWFMI